MNVLIDLSLSDLDTLRGVFAQHENVGGLTETEFIDALSMVCAKSGVKIDIEENLKRLFASIDVLGEDRVSWDSFSMYFIELNLRGRPLNLEGGALRNEEEELVFRPYRIKQIKTNPYGNCVSDVRAIPKIGKIVKVVKDNAGLSLLELHEATRSHALCSVTQPQNSAMLAWDYIPLKTGIPHSNSIACSYNGGYLRLFTIDKSLKFSQDAKEGVFTRFKESQNSVRWLESRSLLALGSRSGVVSLWSTCDKIILQKRLFFKSITSIQSKGHVIYAASMDRNESVKCFDIERQIVRFSFDDHRMGGVMAMEKDENLLFSVGLERHIVQRPLSSPNVPPVLLYDRTSPHKGRITSLERMKNMPFLVSGDIWGNIKFWDIRMSACVQTIPSLVFSSNRRNIQAMSELNDDVRGHAASPVHNICHLGRIGEVSVSTSHEQLTLTAEVAARPDLMDDRHTCRFALFPNLEDLITVHDRGAKLWSISTGMLVNSKPSMVNGDITACCVVSPLNRQILLGTMEGEVAAFSVSLLHSTIDMTRVLREFIHSSEIISLNVIEKYRDLPSSYALVATQASILLVPIVPWCSASLIVHLQALIDVFMSGQKIQVTAVTPTNILIATSNGTVHVVDYQQHLAITHTFTLSSSVETIIARSLSPPGREEPSRTLCKPCIAFFVDMAGYVHIVALRVNRGPINLEKVSMRRRSSVITTPRFEILGGWIPSRPDSWTPNDNRCSVVRMQSTDLTPSVAWGGLRRFSVSRNSFDCEPVLTRVPPRKPSHLNFVTDSMQRGLDADTWGIVLVVFLERYGVVATAEDEGVVKLWDVREHIAHCHSFVGSVSAPVLIASWSVPNAGMVFLGAADHPTLLLPMLLIATGDLRAHVWTADGVQLGTLASGRTAERPLVCERFGVRPYTVAADTTTAELWAQFLSYMQREQRVAKQESLPPVALMMSHLSVRRGTMRPRRSHIGDADGATASRICFPSMTGAQSEKQSSLVEKNFPVCAQRSWRECSLVILDPMDDSSEVSVEQDEVGKNGKKGRIVKAAHRELVTRTPVSFSLGQTGVFRLPPLMKRPGIHKR